MIGPGVAISMGITGVRARWVEVGTFLSGAVGIPLLCVWCAIYVRDEAQRVRVALIWVACLFFFLLGFLLTHRHVT
jgi:hypothetical protein